MDEECIRRYRIVSLIANSHGDSHKIGLQKPAFPFLIPCSRLRTDTSKFIFSILKMVYFNDGRWPDVLCQRDNARTLVCMSARSL